MHAILMSRLEDLWREIKKGDEEMRAQGKERALLLSGVAFQGSLKCCL